MHPKKEIDSKIIWRDNESDLEHFLKYNEEESSSDDEFIESATIEKIKNEKEDLDQKNSDETVDNAVMEYGTIKKEINGVNEVTAEEYGAYEDVKMSDKTEVFLCFRNNDHESSVKLEIIRQEEFHINNEEDNKTSLNEKKYNEEENKDMYLESTPVKISGNKKLNKGKQKPGNPLSMLYQCPECLYRTKYKHNLKSHSLRHKKQDEIDWYSCPVCPYVTSRKFALKSHSEIHKSKGEKKHPRKTKHQCPKCPYKTSHKSNFMSHTETHNSNILLMLKCSKCSYETSRSTSLKRHLVKHRANIQWMQCTECSFKAHQPSRMRRHILTHKSDAFKCTKCPYQTGRKDILTAHQLKHESMDKWFSCPLCPYRSYDKKSIKSHCRRHHNVDFNNPKQIETFQCADCSYETGCKLTLKMHRLIHDQNSWLQCPDCAYSTPYKRYLKKHQVRHQDQNGKDSHRCLECSFKTMCKRDLQQHLITHKSEDEIQWFECSQCSFKTAYRSYLKRHQLKHKETQEIINWLWCYECSFKTKYKPSLVRHIISKHKK